ncbi:hypothetical protein BCR36DRAFT_584070 [Piromyces finnis]|uniref:Uncharacterized protein n=1 Tax=Piromyces finnis TaxID=1754191 RepID=A0A1Y1V7F1_9FUNG|nr:hypothetical protein BCR36DRAFT_584070 [Piromyces finnis]|eukprot:ORX48950.1 hypothetical protein BCR36DRAFT_584070 [Piromyces finnis]
MKNADSYKNMLVELSQTIKNKISIDKIINKETISAAQGSRRGIWCLTLGSYSVDIDYNFIPVIGWNTVKIHFSGYDIWDFEWNNQKGFWYNFVEEKLPEVCVGSGKSFKITYKFDDEISLAYLFKDNWLNRRSVDTLNFTYNRQLRDSFDNNENSNIPIPSYIYIDESVSKSSNSIQNKIYLNAFTNIGETAWAFSNSRQAKRKANVYFNADEFKCNLFVYEVILASGYDVGTPNKLNGFKHPILAAKSKLDRPPCTKDWYSMNVPGFDFIGEGDYGIKHSMPGDIITDGHHMGIVAGNGVTISASTFKVVSNDWGFRGNEKNPVRIFRIESNYLSTRSTRSTSISDNSIRSTSTPNDTDKNDQTDICDTCYCNTDMKKYYIDNNLNENTSYLTNNGLSSIDDLNLNSNGTVNFKYISLANVFIILMSVMFWQINIVY